MGITIKDIAKEADVSIATVSHVINKTRYVSPDLVERVELAMKRTGYDSKIYNKKHQLRVGKLSEIALVIPNVNSTVYAQLGEILTAKLAEKGYVLSIYLTKDDEQTEKNILSRIMVNKRIAGIILVPTSKKIKIYAKLINLGIPFICVERTIAGENIECILSENAEAIYKGTVHLIKSGHERIGILFDEREITTAEERIDGYKSALLKYGIKYDASIVYKMNLNKGMNEKFLKTIKKSDLPTAFIATGNYLTFELLKYIDEAGLECPKDVSIVGFGDDEWCKMVNPPLTTLNQNTQKLAQETAEMILKKINREAIPERTIRVPVDLTIRKSTQIIGRGPLGEKAIYPEQMVLKEEDIKKLKQGNYKVGISFHYTGTEWTRLHELAIRDTLEKFGVMVVSVTDSHFDPMLQITQLEGLKMQKPDAIISIPSDEQKTADKFKEISKTIKLIFIGSIPYGFKSEDYYACVSVNERENGQNAGIILGDYFINRPNVKIGLMNHGMPFFITSQRDFAVEQVLTENYSNIEIVAKENFYQINNAYDVCRKMIEEHPEIEGMYISWERPALEAIRALKDMGRMDVSISTVDLDFMIASYMARGEMVRGLSAQRPYDQGIAVAVATANALLGEREYKYIGVEPYIVLPKNLSKAWRDIIRTAEPDFLVENADLQIKLY